MINTTVASWKGSMIELSNASYLVTHEVTQNGISCYDGKAAVL